MYKSIIIVTLLSGCAAHPGQWREDIGLSPAQSPDRTAANMALIAAGAQLMQASGPQPAYQLPIAPPRSYAPAPAYGNAYVTGYLQSNSVNGSLKYCRYSNGAVITVAAHQLCSQSTQ